MNKTASPGQQASPGSQPTASPHSPAGPGHMGSAPMATPGAGHTFSNMPSLRPSSGYGGAGGISPGKPQVQQATADNLGAQAAQAHMANHMSQLAGGKGQVMPGMGAQAGMGAMQQPPAVSPAMMQPMHPQGRYPVNKTAFDLSKMFQPGSLNQASGWSTGQSAGQRQYEKAVDMTAVRQMAKAAFEAVTAGETTRTGLDAALPATKTATAITGMTTGTTAQPGAGMSAGGPAHAGHMGSALSTFAILSQQLKLAGAGIAPAGMPPPQAGTAAPPPMSGPPAPPQAPPGGAPGGAPPVDPSQMAQQAQASGAAPPAVPPVDPNTGQPIGGDPSMQMIPGSPGAPAPAAPPQITPPTQTNTDIAFQMGQLMSDAHAPAAAGDDMKNQMMVTSSDVIGSLYKSTFAKRAEDGVSADASNMAGNAAMLPFRTLGNAIPGALLGSGVGAGLGLVNSEHGHRAKGTGQGAMRGALTGGGITAGMALPHLISNDLANHPSLGLTATLAGGALGGYGGWKLTDALQGGGKDEDQGQQMPSESDMHKAASRKCECGSDMKGAWCPECRKFDWAKKQAWQDNAGPRLSASTESKNIGFATKADHYDTGAAAWKNSGQYLKKPSTTDHRISPDSLIGVTKKEACYAGCRRAAHRLVQHKKAADAILSNPQMAKAAVARVVAQRLKYSADAAAMAKQIGMNVQGPAPQQHAPPPRTGQMMAKSKMPMTGMMGQTGKPPVMQAPQAPGQALSFRPA